MINNVTSGLARPTLNTRNSTGNLQLPTIPSHIPTSGQSNLSDEQFKAKIEDLARREVAAGRNSRSTPVSDRNELWRLREDFTSTVSPD
jgi:hypothetical protein